MEQYIGGPFTLIATSRSSSIPLQTVAISEPRIRLGSQLLVACWISLAEKILTGFVSLPWLQVICFSSYIAPFWMKYSSLASNTCLTFSILILFSTHIWHYFFFPFSAMTLPQLPKQIFFLIFFLHFLQCHCHNCQFFFFFLHFRQCHCHNCQNIFIFLHFRQWHCHNYQNNFIFYFFYIFGNGIATIAKIIFIFIFLHFRQWHCHNCQNKFFFFFFYIFGNAIATINLSQIF